MNQHVYRVCTLIFFGVGVGLGMQQPFIATQATLAGPDITLGTSIIMFLQLLSGAVLVSVGQNVFLQALPQRLAEMVPSIDASAIAALGAEDLPARLGRLYDAEQASGVLAAYNAALRVVFIVAVATVCVSALGSLGVEYRNLLPPPPPSLQLRMPARSHSNHQHRNARRPRVEGVGPPARVRQRGQGGRHALRARHAEAERRLSRELRVSPVYGDTGGAMRARLWKRTRLKMEMR